MPATCTSASTSQAWQETGAGSYEHQQQPSAAGNTPSDARPRAGSQPCPGSEASRPPALARRPLSAARAALRASGSAEPAAPAAPRLPRAVPASSQTPSPRSVPALGGFGRWTERPNIPRRSGAIFPLAHLQLARTAQGSVPDSPPARALCAPPSRGTDWTRSRLPGMGI